MKDDIAKNFPPSRRREVSTEDILRFIEAKEPKYTSHEVMAWKSVYSIGPSATSKPKGTNISVRTIVAPSVLNLDVGEYVIVDAVCLEVIGRASKVLRVHGRDDLAVVLQIHGSIEGVGNTVVIVSLFESARDMVLDDLRINQEYRDEKY